MIHVQVFLVLSCALAQEMNMQLSTMWMKEENVKLTHLFFLVIYTEVFLPHIWIYFWSGLLFVVCLRPLISSQGLRLNATESNYIKYINSVLSTLWQQFGEGPSPFQQHKAPMHKASSIKKLSQFSVT